MEKNDNLKQQWQNDITESLRSGIGLVTFTKKDGSERVMKCTLQTNFIPESYIPKGTGHKVSEDILSVFDVEASGWRSFRWDSVKTFTLLGKNV
jgi:hypothetical protein